MVWLNEQNNQLEMCKPNQLSLIFKNEEGLTQWALLQPNQKPRKKSYQEQTLRFNGWIKWTQKSTGNVKTKQTVTDVKKRGRNNPMGPISLFQTVLEQLTTKPGT